ncbi:amidase domain-containing protein [Streptacidiphilus sp. PAMC 29251]
MTHAFRSRLAAAAVVAGLVCAGTPALAAPAFAAPPAPARAAAAARSLPDTDVLSRVLEVKYAEAHWNWTAWNDSTAVPFGSAQPDYQCAEFVARALAAAGLVPGLSPDASQDDYFHYTAPNGKVYDLLLISELPQYNNLYAYLLDSGIATDVGDQPAQAKPGDIVVTYLGPDGTLSHVGLVSHAPTATAEATVDAHNNARLDYGYHFYAPSHLVRLVPNAFVEVWAWAATQWALHPIQSPAPTPTPAAPKQLLGRPALTDPAGPQV